MTFLAMLPSILSSVIGAGGAFAASRGKQNKGKFKQVPTMTQEGMNMTKQFAQGTSGALPGAFKYLQDLFSNNPEMMQQMAAPHLRNFREQTIPELSTLFAGLGAGSSSGFQQALGQAGAGLEENLASLFQNQKMQGLNALQGFGTIGQQSPFQSVFMQKGPSGMQNFGNALAPQLGEGLRGLSSFFQNQELYKNLPTILKALK